MNRHVIQNRKRTGSILLGAGLAGLMALGGSDNLTTTRNTEAATKTFVKPRRVEVQGYRGSIMEPFLSRDGKYLFFNNSNSPGMNTDLFYARRVSDLHFIHIGKIPKVNSRKLDAVASMDIHNRFYFTSNRSYLTTRRLLYAGQFGIDGVSNIRLVQGNFAPDVLLQGNMDSEISADGNTLYSTETQFRRTGPPLASDLMIARRKGSQFHLHPESSQILRLINTDQLEYAPATSADELELYFTRADRQAHTNQLVRLRILMATRASTLEPFHTPRVIAAIRGKVEAPTISADGKRLYYHRIGANGTHLYTVERK